MTHHLGQWDLDRAYALTAPAKRRGVRKMSSFLDADQARRQYRAHRPRIDPAISMAPDRGVDGTVIHACRTTDAAEHVLEFRADHRAAAIVEQNHLVLLGAVEVPRPARSRGNRRVAREFLTRCRARQQP